MSGRGWSGSPPLHIAPKIGKKKLTALTIRDVRLLVDDLRRQGAKPRTVQRIHATLRAALQHAFREELVTRNVSRGVRLAQGAAADTPAPFTPDEARRFLAAVESHRLYALWVSLILLGLRRSEACGLHWADVNLDVATMRVERGLQRIDGELRELPTKTRRSTRTVPLPAMAVRVPREHQERQAKERAEAGRLRWQDTEYVFTSTVGTPLEPRNVSRDFRALCRKHGFRLVRLHDMRHTCVTLLLSLGVHPRVVMEIVGHSAMDMTMNVYAHVSLDVQRQALDVLNAELDRPSTEG